MTDREADRPTRPNETDETADLRALVAECIERLEEEGSSALETICERHPENAEAIRRRIERLQAMGLIETARKAPTVPERLGDFRLIRRIGGGGMGVVYLAEQTSLGRQVALKLIRPEHAYFEQSHDRFHREVDAIARLQHPGIVKIYTVAEESAVPYFAMEWVRGCTLAEALHALQDRLPSELTGEDLARAVASCTGKHLGTSDDLTIQDVPLWQSRWTTVCLRIAQRIAEALAHAHERGVVHRDVKPSNVMITPAGEVQLMDFGLASAQGTTRVTQTGAHLGSLPYMSPEQLAGSKEIDEQTDVYSLGVTLYELLSLRLPYFGKSHTDTQRQILEAQPRPLRTINPHVSRDVETVCSHAMAPEAVQRYQRAADLASDIGNVLAHRPIEARRPSLWLRGRKWVRRHPTVTVSALLALSILVGLPTGFALHQVDVAERERARADEQRQAAARLEVERQRAVRGFHRAKDAVDRMLTRLGDQLLRDVPTLEPYRVLLLQDAVEFYEVFLREAEGDPELPLELARTQMRLGRIHFVLSQFDEAEEAYRAAARRLDALTPTSVDPSALWLEQAHLARARSRLLLRTEAPEEAEKAARESLSWLERLQGQGGTDDVVHARLMARIDRADALWEMGDVEPVESLTRELLGELTSLLREHPDHLDYTLAQIGRQRVLGKVLLRRGELDDAESHLRAGLERVRALVEEDPSRTALLVEMSHLLTLLGEAAIQRGAVESADHFEERVELLKRLSTLFPSSPRWRVQLANAWNDRALSHRHRGENQAEREAFEKALTGFDAFERDFGDDFEVQVARARAHYNYGGTLMLSGELGPADEHLAVSCRILRKLHSEDPDRPRVQRELGRALMNSGNVALMRREPEAAAEVLEDAIDLFRALCDSPVAGLNDQRQLVMAQASLAGVRQAMGDPDGALEVLRTAIDVSRDLVRENPRVVAIRLELAQELVQSAFLLLQGSELTEADRLAVEAADHCRALAKADPRNPRVPPLLTEALAARVVAGVASDEARDAVQALEGFVSEAAPSLTPAGRRSGRLVLELTAGLPKRIDESEPLSDPERKAMSAVWKASYFELLSALHRRNMIDAEYLQTAPAFEPLRERDDFRRFLQAIQEGG